MSYKYSRYISRVTRSPWAILPEKFAVIADLVRERAAGAKPSDEEIAERLSADGGPGRTERTTDGYVAVLPVHGTIAYRADSFTASSGGASCEMIGRQLDRLMADATIKAILMDFDTPGGSVDGLPELSAKIAKHVAGGTKPIVAHVNALAASAGYWLAAKCSEVVCTPSGRVGSIGVFMLLIDESEAMAKAGVKVNAIVAGDYKLEGAPWQPLSDESRAYFQAKVDVVYGDFLSAVAKGRGVTAAVVRKTYGQGRCLEAPAALEAGMIDRIATFEDTIARLASGPMPQQAGRRAATVTGDIIMGDPQGQEDGCDTCDEGCPCPEDGPCEPGCETCAATCACARPAESGEAHTADDDALAILAALSE